MHGSLAKATSRLTMFGEVGGRFGFSVSDSDIAYFVEKAAAAGMQRLVCSYYHHPTPDFPSYLLHRGQLMRIEAYEYGERSPLAHLVRRAHASGLQVVAFVNVALGGQWIRSDYVASGEAWPYVRLIGGGIEQSRYWTHTRDGRTWLDMGPRLALGSAGYVALSYPEIREREQTLLLDFLSLGVDAVQLEFMISGPPAYAARTAVDCCDADGYWAYGYDEPSIAEFRQEYGIDPRTLPNSDPAWVQFRADYATQYVRELRQRLDRVNKGVELSILAFSGTFRSPEAGLAVGVDWEAWLREGLVDVIYTRIPGDRPPLPWRARFTPERIQAMHDEFAAFERAVALRATAIPVIEMPIYPLTAAGQTTSEEAGEAVTQTSTALLAAGARQIGFWWFDTVEQLDLWSAVRSIASHVV